MNSRKVESKSTPDSVDAGGRLSAKGKSHEESSYEEGNVVHLNHRMNDIEIEPKQDDRRGFIGKHSIDQPGVAAGKEWTTSSGDPKAWGPSQGTDMQSWDGTGAGKTSHNSWDQVINSKGSVGGGNSKAQQSNSSWGSRETAYKVPPPAIPPPLHNGWQWSSRDGKPGLRTSTQVKNSNVHPHDESIALYDPEFDKLPPQDADGDVNEDDELLDDSEDDISDGFDSDDSQKSHDTRKKNKWLRPFFEALDNLSLEQINGQARRWHCPACQGGPGAIGWYIGLQALMTHAKTKGRVRMRLHRELAELLEEELQRRGTSVIPIVEAFGKWKGLFETTDDHEIVWPPMVVIMNTLLEKDENEKWKGMCNQELLEYFNTYEAVKVRHSYGPNGHRGMSVLIFEASAMGYLEAERLHKQFIGEGRDRDAWERHPVLFYPGGSKRQLYGFLSSKEDVIIFNQHSHGEAWLKFEMRSYQEMVVGPMKQMSEDNQKLIWLKNKVVKQEQRSKALEETFGMVSQKLRDTMEENRIVRPRTKIQHEENKEEMDYQDKFFKDQMDKIHKVTEEKERAFEKLLQEERSKVKQSDDPETIVDCRRRKEEIQSFITGQLKGIAEFETERAKLINAHEEKKIELKRKYLTEEIELEKNFDVDLTKLMEKKEEIQSFITGQLKGIEEFETERSKLINAREEKKIELKRKYLTEEIELEKNFDVDLTKLMEKYAPPTFQISRSS